MDVRRRILVVPVVVALSMGATSCEFIKSCLECLCGDIDQGNSGITGNPKVDSFFAAAIELDQSTAMANARMDAALADLRVVLGLPAGASLDDIRAAIDAAFSTAGITFDVSYEPAECRADIDVAARAAAECDVTVDPGEVSIECEGHCEGTCQATCTGECRLPTVYAYCEGACHGSCSLDVDGACYGTCRGSCVGTCSVDDGSGGCAGSCDGTCTGYCEVTVEGSCTGECYGECGIDVSGGECNAQCEGSCEGHCEGSCDGTIRPPDVDAQCQAQIEARVEASVECDPPQLDFGVDASGVEHVAEITYHLGQILAISSEAQAILGGVEGFLVTMNGAAESIINGEVAENKLICALAELDDAIAILNEANVTLNYILTVQVTLVL
jgi:hypothetical protein